MIRTNNDQTTRHLDMHHQSAVHVPYPDDALPGIYIHIPYCKRICPYCDFNVYARSEAQIPAYLDALNREFALAAERFPAPGAQTIFIGGGTPTLLEPAQVASMLETLHKHYSFRSDAEITMEANPEGLTTERLAGYRAAGVNRLSIGVQTQQSHGLKVLGRAHRPEVPATAIPEARKAGFDNLSLDFIFGWPGQTVEDWRQDLETISKWEPEHVSMYSLIIEPNTPYQRAVDRKILIPVDDDTTAEMYDMAREHMSRGGWDHYEISNWGRTPEHRSRHNIIYWANSRYLAFGAGAHGYMGTQRYSNLRLPREWMDRIQQGALPIADQETITPELAMAESMILGLRLVRDGVSRPAFQLRHGVDPAEFYRKKIERLEQLELLEVHPDRLQLSERGMLLGNDVAIEFLPDPEDAV